MDNMETMHPEPASFVGTPAQLAVLAGGLRRLGEQSTAAEVEQVLVATAIELSCAPGARFVHAAQPVPPGATLWFPVGTAKVPRGHLVLDQGAADSPAMAMLLDILASSATVAFDNAALREHLQREGAVHRASEAELSLKQNLLRTLVENIPFRIYAKDRQSRFLFGNHLMARLAGVASPAELYGKTDYQFFPEELAAKYFADEQQILESGEALIGYEELVQDQDTGELGWTVTTKVLLRNDEGEITGIVGIGYDVTQRKQMEARLVERSEALQIANATLHAEKVQQQILIRKLGDMQGQLLQSEKMASIGLLAAGVAHEINNPLAFISSNFSALERDSQQILELISAYEKVESLLPAHARPPIITLKQDIGLEEIRLDMDALLNESLDGLNRVKQIVQNLKDFSRVGGTENEMANLEEGLDSTLNVAWNEIKYKAEVVKEYAGLPAISCLPSQINQVFLNLIINAAHAIEDKGVITVRTGYDADNVWIEIEDNGSGIAPQHMDHLFEPFFTTKPIGKGTGLGLSIVYGIVQGHHGTIEVDSTFGSGTVFKVKLPRKA